MEEFKQNSFKSREPASSKNEKKVPALKGNVEIKKKSFMDIIGEKIAQATKSAWKNIIVPSAQKMASEGANILINTLIYGESRGNGYNNQYSNMPKVSYRNPGTYWRESDMRNNDYYNRGYSTVTDYQSISFQYERDAQEVLEAMRDCIRRKYRNGAVSISDLCEFSRQPSNYTDERYGWTDLTYARVIPSNGKFYLDLPRAMPID